MLGITLDEAGGTFAAILPRIAEIRPTAALILAGLIGRATAPE
jgi:hypothetical protein